MYEIVIERPARRGHRGLDRQAQRVVDAAIQALVTEPLPSGVKALTGQMRGLFRLRLSGPGGEYRIVYAVDHQAHVITIVNIGPREGAY